MLCDPLAHLLGDGLDGAVVERHLQAGGLAQLGVAGRAGTADEAQIARPCILLVMEAQQEEPSEETDSEEAVTQRKVLNINDGWNFSTNDTSTAG